MLKTLILTMAVQTVTTKGDLMDYYNEVTSPDHEEARMIVNDQLKSSTDEYTQALALYLSGYLYRKSGDNLKAAIDYSRSLSLLRSGLDTTDYFLELSVRKNLGSLWDIYLHYDRAIALYNEAIPYAEQHAPKEVANLYSNLGNSYRGKKDSDGAIRAYINSLKIIQNQGDPYLTAQVYNKLGLSFYRAELLDTADYFFWEAINLEAEISGKKRRIIGQVHHNLAQNLKKKGNLSKAKSHFEKALAYKIEKRDQYITLMDLGELLIETKEYVQADAVLKEALTLFSYNEIDGVELYNIYKLLARLSEEIGDYERSLVYSKAYADNLFLFNQQARKMIELESQVYFAEVVESYERDARNKNLQCNLVKVAICFGMLIILTTIALLLVMKSNWKMRVARTKASNMLRALIND